MKENQQILKIYSLSSPLLFTEVFAILGDKYNSALPFRWELTRDLSSAHIVLWDGVVTLRNKNLVQSTLSKLNPGKVLLFINGSATLLKESFTAQVIEPGNVPMVELKGWNILPEEIISAIEACQKKLTYV